MLVYSFSTFCPLSSLLFSPACLIIFGFCPFCSFIQFSLKRHMELLHCEQDLLLHGKEYISSQTVHGANSEPKLLLIVLLFHTFSPDCLLDFQKKSTLLVYSILLYYQILVKFPPCSFIPSCSFIQCLRVA